MPAARQFVAATLATWGLSACDEPARLGVSELVTNALIHAHGDIGVTVRRAPGLVRIEVEDASPSAPVRRTPGPASTNGRGLMVVEAVAHAWGVNHTAEGKRVWFDLPAAAGGTAGTTGTTRAASG